MLVNARGNIDQFQEGGGVSKVNIGSVTTAKVTSHFTWITEIQNGAQWVKYKRLMKMRNRAPIFCPDCSGSLICG